MTQSGTRRFVAGVSSQQVAVLLALASLLPAPYDVLYILHTSRGVAQSGRYQSPELDFEQVQRFLEAHQHVLEHDGRFDLWLHSAASGDTVVWDRHDLFFFYGPVAEAASMFAGRGYREGKVSIPSPHEHHYHASLDEQVRSVIGALEWTYSPLRSEDKQ